MSISAASPGRAVTPGRRATRATLRPRHPWLLGGLLSLGVVAAPAAGLAQDVPARESIEGQVVDATSGAPVAGARVTVEGAALDLPVAADGRFRLRGLPPGALTLWVHAPGYALMRELVTVEARLRPLRFDLKAEPVYRASAVVARRRAETSSTTRLDAREISSAPHRNAEQLLRQVPGVALVQHGSEGKGHQFFLRGFDAVHGADLELRVDGMPINEWSNVHGQGYVDLGFLIPEFLRSVVAIKGPFTLSQGAFSMAGTVDYSLGVPDSQRGWLASYTAGTSNRHRVLLGYAPREGDGAQFVGVEATHDEGFGENRGLQRATFNGRVTLFDHRRLGRLRLFAAAHHADFELPSLLRDEDIASGRVGFFDSYDPATEGASSRALGLLHYHLQRGPSAFRLRAHGAVRRLRLLENFTGYLLDPIHGDRRDQRHDALSVGLTGQLVHRLASSLSLQAGLGLRADRFSQAEHRLGQQRERLDTRRSLEGTQGLLHGRVGSRWKPLQKLQLEGGVRADLALVSTEASGESPLLAFSPRLTLRWAPATLLRVYGAYGRGFRPPEAQAFGRFEPAQSGDLEALQSGGEPAMTLSDAFELGLRWDPADWFGGALSGFVTLLQRDSIFDHVSGLLVELGSTRRLGVELVLHSHPLPWLGLEADLTAVDARFEGSGARLPQAPWLVGAARAVVTHPAGFRAGLRLIALGPRTLPQGAAAGSFAQLDGTLGYRWPRLQLDLAAENLLNSQLREGEYHYASHWRPGAQASQLPALHSSAGTPLQLRACLRLLF